MMPRKRISLKRLKKDHPLERFFGLNERGKCLQESRSLSYELKKIQHVNTGKRRWLNDCDDKI